MKTEFNLSARILEEGDIWDNGGTKEFCLKIEDVKEFIRLLKENISNECKGCLEHPTTIDFIDKLSGDKLI